MLQFLTIIKTVIAILPILRDLILAAEAFFPSQGSGVQKLELVRTLLQNAYETATKAEAPFASIWPVVSGLVNMLVPKLTTSTAAVTAAIAPTVQKTPGSTPEIAVQLASNA